MALGRRDGRTSRAENCGELPPLYGNITVMIEVFAAKGLDVKDLVVLSAGHTLGKAHCWQHPQHRPDPGRKVRR